MRNKFRKAIKCELRYTIFLINLSLKRKSTNEVSEFSLQLNLNGKTQYEQR